MTTQSIECKRLTPQQIGIAITEASGDRTVNTEDGEPLEQNVTRPRTLQPTIRSPDMMRFLEMNELPERDTPYLPIPDESRDDGQLIED